MYTDYTVSSSIIQTVRAYHKYIEIMHYMRLNDCIWQFHNFTKRASAGPNISKHDKTTFCLNSFLANVLTCSRCLAPCLDIDPFWPFLWPPAHPLNSWVSALHHRSSAKMWRSANRCPCLCLAPSHIWWMRGPWWMTNLYHASQCSRNTYICML